MLISSLSKGGENEKEKDLTGRQKGGKMGGDRVKRESRDKARDGDSEGVPARSPSATLSSGVRNVKAVNDMLAAEAGLGVRGSDHEVNSSGSQRGTGGGGATGGSGGDEDVTEDFSFLDSRIGKNIFGGGGENGGINNGDNIVLNEIEGKSRQVDGRSVDHGSAAARLLLNAFGDPGPDSTFNSNSGNDKNIFKSVGKI